MQVLVVLSPYFLAIFVSCKAITGEMDFTMCMFGRFVKRIQPPNVRLDDALRLKEHPKQNEPPSTIPVWSYVFFVPFVDDWIWKGTRASQDKCCKSRLWDSNPGPPLYESGALPLS